MPIRESAQFCWLSSAGTETSSIGPPKDGHHRFGCTDSMVLQPFRGASDEGPIADSCHSVRTSTALELKSKDL